MDRIQSLFKEKKENLLNVYFTAGYPRLENTEEIILSLDAAGADLIEVGMPYSDPLADGPTIQQSGQVALENGMTVNVLFQQLEVVRPKTNLPIILMGYFNQVMQYGEEAFLKKCKEVGVDGLILPDMPLDVFESQYKTLFEKYGLNLIFLMTPQTSEVRIRKIDELSTGFIYVVSSSSITGAKKGISEKQLAYFNRINNLALQNPKMIGFGISDHETFSTACKYANGAIIGSAFIRALANTIDIRTTVFEFINKIKNSPKAKVLSSSSL